MSKLALSLGLALLIAACATPQPPAQTNTSTAGSQSQMVVTRGTQASGEKLICTDSYPMGSHIPQRICVTQADADARQKADQAAMRNLQMQGKEGGCAPNCL